MFDRDVRMVFVKPRRINGGLLLSLGDHETASNVTRALNMEH